MKKRRFSVEQIVGVLKQVDVGVPVAEVIRKVRFTPTLAEAIAAQNGKPPRGFERTVVLASHSAHLMRVSVNERVRPAPRLTLHALQCLGSFWYCFS